MPVTTRRWSIAPQVSASAGKGVTVGAVSFWLRRGEMPVTNTLVFVGGGRGQSILPASGSVTWTKSFTPCPTNRATSFEEIDGKGAAITAASAATVVGAGGPNASWIWLRIFENTLPWGKVLMNLHLFSGGIGGSTRPPEGFIIPDAGGNSWRGQVSVVHHEQDPLDPPDVPDEPADDDHRFSPYIFIPSVLPPEVKPKRRTLKSDLLFGFDSARIRTDAEPELQKLLEELTGRANPNVTIEGHADSTGKAVYNDWLSLERAQAVKDWFMRKGAPAAYNYTAVGVGEKRPIASNSTKEGRAQNRRVEVIIH